MTSGASGFARLCPLGPAFLFSSSTSLERMPLSSLSKMAEWWCLGTSPARSLLAFSSLPGDLIPVLLLPFLNPPLFPGSSILHAPHVHLLLPRRRLGIYTLWAADVGVTPLKCSIRSVSQYMFTATTRVGTHEKDLG